ncbi:hypothetical protein J6590_064677 [Homalodisca vitripennis]|nr:hypothetical protein J6590_064677 [Homalodisca vitripennis]
MGITAEDLFQDYFMAGRVYCGLTEPCYFSGILRVVQATLFSFLVMENMEECRNGLLCVSSQHYLHHSVCGDITDKRYFVTGAMPDLEKRIMTVIVLLSAVNFPVAVVLQCVEVSDETEDMTMLPMLGCKTKDRKYLNGEQVEENVLGYNLESLLVPALSVFQDHSSSGRFRIRHP